MAGLIYAGFPFVYYSVLPDSTLTTKIREESWKLDRLFPLLRKSREELKKLMKSIKSNKADILRLKGSIALLAAEIRSGLKDLKLINFYDSAILYLYFKLLQHVFILCRKEEEKLMEEKENALSGEVRLKGKLEEIRKSKKDVEKKVKAFEKVVNGLDIAKRELAKAYEKLVEELESLRWKAEKRAQKEFSFEELTFRSMENLNRKIKVEALKVKKIIPNKVFLMRKIRRQDKPDAEDAKSLARLVSGAIDRIGKDVSYSSKLISQFQEEMEMLKGIVENLKKTMNKFVEHNRIKEETAKNVIKPWDDAVRYLEKEAHKDLMQVFRNIFVEYKYIGTRQIAA